jgi:hypothetical protein
MKIKNVIDKLNNWNLARRTKLKLIKKFRFDYELELLNEKWIIKRIQDGQTFRRKELTEKQNRIREIEMFVEFLKNL